MHWNLNPDILVLDNNLLDISIKEIINRISCTPIEKKKSNTIFIFPTQNKLKLADVQKVNKILYKPNCKEKIIKSIKKWKFTLIHQI